MIDLVLITISSGLLSFGLFVKDHITNTNSYTIVQGVMFDDARFDFDSYEIGVKFQIVCEGQCCKIGVKITFY